VSLFTRPSLRIVEPPKPATYPTKPERGPVEITPDGHGRFWLSIRTASDGCAFALVTEDTMRTLADVIDDELKKANR
jgi:hypothetical protein